MTQRLDELDELNYEVPAETPSIDRGGITMALERADWHLRKLEELNRREDEVRYLFDRELARITERRDEVLAKIGRAQDWHRRPLVQLHEAILDTDPTRKSIVLPHGTLRSRTPQKPTVIVDDAAALLEWAKANHPEAIPPATRVTISKLDLVTTDEGKVADRTTGEIVPGVHAHVGRTTFSIDLPDGLEPA